MTAALPDNHVPSPFRTREQRSAERAEKREAVLRAAVRMFNARGFHATSLDDVAASLGISKPTIYHYLGNKEQVLIECVTRGLELLSVAAEEVRAAPGDGLTRLRAFLHRYARLMMDDYCRCVVRTGDESLSPEGAALFRARKRGIDQSLRALIADGVADGSIAPVDVRMAAFMLAGALNWPGRWHDPAGPMSPEAIADALVDLLIRGLAPRA
ncbi:TetR/AcrR family transcriptional regulator [Sphingobium sp. HBC34]|uniref:TetR/AcrR family transcriptional regulator n=1 Tax=Sphingobium cyanobacteriorum TaxID=3063954 RepID=A0ABT8ZPQ6_9SPHN|nr:TetR/AcrR family transcriptional regulator [Sphingobium sp. HBC34]MDO7835496.1 TetR/AcrR family transcriptional regulator [Sphingobium sp. HBC34]